MQSTRPGPTFGNNRTSLFLNKPPLMLMESLSQRLPSAKANTKEVLAIVNRSGSVHSAHNAAGYLNKAIWTCKVGGFKRIRMRGDCKFSQTEYLDGWDAIGVRFQFGYEAKAKLKEIADNPKTKNLL